MSVHYFSVYSVSGDLPCISLIKGIILYYCIAEGSLRLKHLIAIALIVVNVTNELSLETATSSV